MRSRKVRGSSFVLWAALAPLLLLAQPAGAANGDCGIPVTSGATPKTGDCLYVLRAAVGQNACALCVCDTNGNLMLAASDALLCLKVALART